MSDLPAESAAPPALPQPPKAPPSLDNNFLAGFAGLPIVRQLGVMVGIAASVALGFALVLWSQDPDYRPLTDVVSPRQANAVVDALQASGIPHRLDGNTGMVLVPAERIHEARMKMAGAGIVDGSQMGVELLERDQGFGVSQFAEVARHRRSLEGELARSIGTINAVSQARVHLAIPKQTAFLRDQRQPTASVTLKLLPGRELDGDQVRAVMNLVAGAVPELSADRVAVVDHNGKLLSRQDADPGLEQTERQLEYIARLESQLQDKVARILTSVVGRDRFQVQINAAVDFTVLEQTAESFDPEQRALRSEQSLEESRTGGELAGGVPGALSNQPPPPATVPETAEAAAETQAAASRSESNRVQATRNFEVDRTISHTRHPVGRIERLSVSVVVDQQKSGAAADAEGEEGADASWSEAELAELTELVKSAVGFSADRGDQVTVVGSPFYVPETELLEAAPFWTEPWFMEMVRLGLGAVGVLLIMLMLLRPLFKTLSQAGESKREQEYQALQQQLLAAYGPQQGPEQERISWMSDSHPKLGAVRNMAAESPETVARVVRQWTLANE